jgi:hypothetical protein
MFHHARPDIGLGPALTARFGPESLAIGSGPSRGGIGRRREDLPRYTVAVGSYQPAEIDTHQGSFAIIFCLVDVISSS